MTNKRNTLTLYLTAAALLIGSYASAATRTFTGGTSSAWEDSTNWSLGNLPGAGDRTRFSADATLSTPWTVSQFWADTGGNVTIANGGNLTTSTANPSMDFRNNSSLTIQDGGTVTSLRRLRWLDFPVSSGAQTLAVNAGGTLNATLGEFSGGTLQIAGDVTFSTNLRTGGTSFATSITVLDLQPGGNLTVNGAMRWDGANAVTVGSGSTLLLGDTDHIFTDGLTIGTGGTLGSDSNAAFPNAGIATGALTLNNGSTLDYSINGTTAVSDTWSIGDDLILDPGSLNLVVDVVSGTVTDSQGSWTIFDWSGVGATGPSLAEFNAAPWAVTAADGTRFGTVPTVSYFGDASSGSIVLSSFEAFAIPEPSTAMLLGMGAMVMILRRRIRR